MTSWWAALAIALAVPPLPPRWLPLADALGTILAGPLVAAGTAPAVDVSAMDGYAVSGDPPWRLLGRTLAGEAVPPPLSVGQAWEVATGAPVPRHASGVLPYEAAALIGTEVTGNAALARHIRRAGDQCHEGQLLLRAGTPVSPLVLGLAAQAGLDALLVQTRPRVVVLVSGDELISAGVAGPGQARDALGPMLPGLLAGYGAELVEQSRLSDAPGAMMAALTRTGADVLIVTGASSRGPADHLRPALAECGARLLVDGVQCRPGHPMLLAQLPDRRFVVGLPGNPLAAVVAAVTLVQPLLCALAGAEPPPVVTAKALLGLTGHSADVTLLPVVGNDQGVSPTNHSGAAQLLGVSLANGLAVVPAGGVLAGDQVDVIPLNRS